MGDQPGRTRPGPAPDRPGEPRCVGRLDGPGRQLVGRRSTPTAIEMHPVPISDRRDEPLLRGVLERHALAAVPRRDQGVELRRRRLERVRGGQRTVRDPDRQHRTARTPSCGSTTTTCSSSRDAARPAVRRPDRMVQPHPVPAARAVPAPAVANGDHQRSARRRRARVPARTWRPELRRRGPPTRRTRPRSTTTWSNYEGRHVLRRQLPDLDRRRRLRAARQRPGDPRNAPRRSAPGSATPR